MTYQTPVNEPNSSVWAMTVRDTSGPGPYYPQFDWVSDNGLGEFAIEDAETLFQKIVTVLDGHADLEIVSAGRRYPTAQDVTP
jgi:hypothetical protein